MKSKIGILLICLYGALNYGSSFVKEISSMYYDSKISIVNPWDDLNIDRYEDSLREVNLLLPNNCIIGLVSDADNDVDRWRVLILTQYVLVPRIVVEDNGSLPIVVGSFQYKNINTDFLKNKNLQKWKDFENGIILFRRVKEKS